VILPFSHFLLALDVTSIPHVRPTVRSSSLSGTAIAYPSGGGHMNENVNEDYVESLIEEVSIDGMCGVY
jgi:mycofactocin precursor